MPFNLKKFIQTVSIQKTRLLRRRQKTPRNTMTTESSSRRHTPVFVRKYLADSCFLACVHPLRYELNAKIQDAALLLSQEFLRLCRKIGVYG
jgi:hypothetical protein